jgi:tricorn protease
MNPISSDHAGHAYIQHPTIFEDRIVFSAEGNLWEVGVEGGTARRLTSSSATHTFPRFSPDGRWIAFSSADEGPSAIWVMPSNGGEARRLTFHAWPDQVVGWTPDGQDIVFRTMAVEGIRAQTLATVPAMGGAVADLGYGRASTIAYHADGERVAVHRHSHDPAWWKRYSGGRAGRIWLGSTSTGEFERMPGGPRTDACPMWIGDQLWFLSDEDGMGDIWVADADGANRRRVTSNEAFFARWPQAHGSRIVYSAGGRLFVLDTADDTPAPREVEVDVRGHSLASRRKFVPVPKSIGAFGLSHDGSTTLLTVRGRVVALPNWHGAARTVAAAPGVRFREGAFLGADGRVVAVAQIDGEDKLVLVPAEGNGNDLANATVLGGVGRRIRSIAPSPDGKRVAILDQGRGLHVATLSEDGASAEIELVDDEGNRWVSDCSWSPCSTWLAWSRSMDWWSTRVFIWSPDAGVHRVSRDEFVDFSPAWDPAGRFLAILSSRHLDPYSNMLEHDFAFVAPTRAYAVMLRKGEQVPFASDVAPPEKPPEAVTDPIQIDLDGLSERIAPFPFEAGRYFKIGCSLEGVAVLQAPIKGWLTERDPAAESPDRAPFTVMGFDLAERKVDTVLKTASWWEASADGKRWLYKIGTKLRCLPAAKKLEVPPHAPDQDRVSRKTGWMDLGRVTLAATPRAEFRQIVEEAWALQRDHFYDASLVNVDWEACLQRYLPLVDRIRTREELMDLLWELQGELGTSHAYAMGGDMPFARRYAPGQLGCDYEQDEGGAYRITRIFAGDPWAEKQHSPLAAPGKDVGEGDFLLAVDGHAVGGDVHPNELLLEKAGRTVMLTVADDAAGNGSREVSVTPIGDDKYLRYRAWVDANRAKVAEATDGRIGYLHIPDMGLPGAVEFHRNFLWQVQEKKGFVIDNRFNGGGNISGILIAKLLRQIVGYTASRWSHTPRTYPYHAPMGPIVVLTNENAGSDGDIFSQAVKATGLGPLIGMRTWGGVVGIDRAKDLVDGGFTTQPEYAFWFHGVRWSVENHGVDPDIEVDRTPGDALHDRDPQLDRAIAEVMSALEKGDPIPPDLGPTPDLRYPK